MRARSFLLLTLLGSAAAWAAPVPVPEPKRIFALLKERTGKPQDETDREFAEARKDEGALVSAVLGDEDKASGKRPYRFHVALALPAWLSLTRDTLTDYTVFKRIVPFVTSAAYDKDTRILDLAGGVLGWNLRSLIRFDEKSPRWIDYEIIGGDLKGLRGRLIFEAAGAGETLVYMDGDLEAAAKSWPPAWVMELGGLMVLRETAKSIRKEIVDRKRKGFENAKPEGKQKDVEGIPQPRSRLVSP